MTFTVGVADHPTSIGLPDCLMKLLAVDLKKPVADRPSFTKTTAMATALGHFDARLAEVNESSDNFHNLQALAQLAVDNLNDLKKKKEDAK